MAYVTLPFLGTQRRFEVKNGILDLSARNIYNLDTIIGLSQLKDLHTLDLSYNQLKSIEELRFLRNLKNLNLSFNKIYSLQGLQFLSEIKCLDLAHNEIRSATDTRSILSRLPKLKRLYVESNPFSSAIRDWRGGHYWPFYILKGYHNVSSPQANTTFNWTTASAWSLVHPILSARELFPDSHVLQNAVKAALKHPKELAFQVSFEYRREDYQTLETGYRDGVLYINDIRLNYESIAEIIYETRMEILESLRKMILTNCTLYVVLWEFTDYFPNLELLDLSGNEFLSNFRHPLEFDDLPSLRRLKLARDGIENLNYIIELKSLQELDLSSNKLKRVEGIENLSNLEYLSLSSNEISDIEPLYSLPKLKAVDLSYNNDLPNDIIEEFMNSLKRRNREEEKVPLEKKEKDSKEERT